MKQLLLVVLLLSTISLSAKESGYSLSVALVGMRMDYREYDDARVILNSEKSAFNEIIGSEFTLDYTEAYSDNTYAQAGIEMLFLGGRTKYVGSLIGSGLGYGSYLSTTQNNISDISVYYMYSYSFNNGLDFGYGLALGHRSWERILSASQIEVYYWFSLRPRAKLTYKFAEFCVGALVEYQYGISPKMSATGFASDFNLGSANIAKLKIPFTYTLNKQLSLFTEYVYEQQIIEKSNVQASDADSSKFFLEPDSTANNQYIKIGATFKF
ncbi:hypothetical protein JHD47_09055 [Sulfurimonas sp. SAG-AH-194-L11]|nr:hypothetical protein [Sulfurimonas sp. SAG-AH-194-L11]MDF1877961.1 hypothetical protein [Sulfurimonas sp. SAG-AH-194-L11]